MKTSTDGRHDRRRADRCKGGLVKLAKWQDTIQIDESPIIARTRPITSLELLFRSKRISVNRWPADHRPPQMMKRQHARLRRGRHRLPLNPSQATPLGWLRV